MMSERGTIFEEYLFVFDACWAKQLIYVNKKYFDPNMGSYDNTDADVPNGLRFLVLCSKKTV